MGVISVGLSKGNSVDKANGGLRAVREVRG